MLTNNFLIDSCEIRTHLCFLQVQCFLAYPAGFSREVDLFTLAFNIILLQKNVQLRFYN